ncbi:DNA-directed DNA polymerase epsilon, subunit B [Ptychographa xylographoides]|nr:DNA-directed DNA polymerase epsilon, subunit B [Ptychographa xylographoides]
MSDFSRHTSSRTAALSRSVATPASGNVVPSSSPAFATPVHPIRFQKPTTATILPILLPAATLRPLAFRTFTKKYDLTLNSAALEVLAAFIGKHCGSGWRHEGLAEKVLEETAKSWKRSGGSLIVEGDRIEFRDILRSLESSMDVATIRHNGGLSLGGSCAAQGDLSIENLSKLSGGRPGLLSREESQTSLEISRLKVDDSEEQDTHGEDPQRWLKVINAFEQPRLKYDANRKHFEKVTTPALLFPDRLHKTQVFRDRYNLIHQRLLRNESFQTPTVAINRNHSLQRSSSTIATAQEAYKLTPIANLLGRPGSSHVLLGLLTIAPTGALAISDLTGSITLDLHHARPIPENGAWFTPGMIVIVDGIYEEEGPASSGLGGVGGVGGTIGGRFVGLSLGGPPCERREVTLGVGGVNGEGDMSAGGGFGWVDFLGVGSERATGPRMRKLEECVLRSRSVEALASGRSNIVIVGEVNLDIPRSIQALRKVLATYAVEAADDLPMAFVLVGNFVRNASMAGGGSGGSIEYKEYFDSLAAALSDFPTVLHAATFVFVPGDNDPWASAFSAGAATALPRRGIPELFTTRVKRAFSTANAEAEASSSSTTSGEAIWTSNPARLALFGPSQEIVIFRDELSGRLRRSAITFQVPRSGKENSTGEGVNADEMVDDYSLDNTIELDELAAAVDSPKPAPHGAHAPDASTADEIQSARKLVKTILDQGHLSPFPLASRPILWDYADALRLYPLPTALVLVEPDTAPFAITYEGCHVMNPGRLLAEGRRGLASWLEYDTRTRRGKTRESMF